MTGRIRFDALHNFRDLGGCRTVDGRRVRPGRLYRADSLGKLREGTEDWSRFLALGVRTVIDLRHPWEIEARGRVPDHPSLTYRNLGIEHRPYDQAALTADVAAGPYLAERYMEVAEDGTAEIRQALELIAESKDPLVFHCASGKDRTGQLAALILTLLDVPEPTITEDFARTNRATKALLADWTTRNNNQPPTWPAYAQAPTEVMTLYLAAMKTRYGSIDAYVSDQLGLKAEALRESLRNTLLEHTG
ncbi:tyrosine-protein phosphatase [Streptomyces sp. NPDC000983]|uniref:tyrosine-protein phosphatase n=1 Tax=Streptomyces sp. NPDC000983 TaxID=3154373 RepID=UPI003333B69A